MKIDLACEFKDFEQRDILKCGSMRIKRLKKMISGIT